MAATHGADGAACPDRASGGRGAVMAMQRVTVPYEHDPADLQTIYLAVVTSRGEPRARDWRPAYRDERHGRRVVYIRAEVPPRNVAVWLKDRNGVRRATRFTVGD